MTRSFLAVSDVDHMTQLTGEALRACNALIGALSADLNDRHHERIRQVLDGGGRVGMELCVNAKGEQSVCLVAIELEGYRTAIVQLRQEAKEIPPPH